MKRYFARLAVLLAALMPVAAQAAQSYTVLKPTYYYKDGKLVSKAPDFISGYFGTVWSGASAEFSCMPVKIPGYYANNWSLQSFTFPVKEYTSSQSERFQFTYTDDIYTRLGTDQLTIIVSITQMWYSVSYQPNGGSWVGQQPSTRSREYSSGGTLPTGDDITREGYTLTGWKVGDTSTILEPGASFTGSMLGVKYNNQTVTLTAQWAANSYTAKIAAGEGGTGGCTVNYDYSTSQQSKAITLPTRTGHTIDKWTASAYSGSAPTIEGASLKIPAGTTGNFTMTPTWKAVSCVITTGVTPAGSGTVSGGKTYDYGATVTLTATAKTGYAFVQWQDGNTDNPRTFTATESATYTATFKALTYTAKILPGEGGTGGCTTNYAYSTSAQTMTITLPTRTGHTISDWEAVGQTGTAPTIKGTTLTIPGGTYGSFTMTPIWKAVSCVITTGVTPAGSGTVEGGKTYDYGATVTLTATAKTGYAFVQWQDGNTDNPRTFTATESATYTATFKASTYTAKILPGEGGTGGCTTNYAYSTSAQTMTITLPTRTGHTILDWEAVGQTGTAPTIKGTTLTIPGGTYGSFTMTPTWKAVSCTITTSVTPSGAGTVSGGGTYDYGKSVTLTANPNKGYGFQQWQDGNTDNPRTITATESTTYTATFQTQGYTATIAKGEKGSGGCQIGYDYSESQQTKTIQSMPTRRGHSISGWTATGYSGSTPTINDTTLTIPAKTSGDFTMTPSWKANTITVVYYGNGETAGTMSDSTFTYDVQAALRMNAFGKSYTVTYNPNSGSVTPLSDSAVYKFLYWNNQKDGKGAYTYENREIVTNPCGAEDGIVPLYAQWEDADPVILPTPEKEGSAFLGWYTAQTGGELVGVGGSEYVPQKKITLFAHWGTQYTITTAAKPTEGGTVSGGGSYESGATVTLTAKPNEGYSFEKWTDDPSALASRQITVTKSATYTAVFTGNVYKVTLSADPGTVSPSKINVTFGQPYGKFPVPKPESGSEKTLYRWIEEDSGAEITETTIVSIPAKHNINAEWYAPPLSPVYYVAFDDNGATSGTMGVQTIPTNTPTALTKNYYKKTGASFAGWADEKGGAVVYQDQQEVTDIAAPGQTNTLYATWTPWKNYVKFDGNGKTSGEMAVQTFEYGVAQALSKNAFTKEDFTFQGWTNETKKAFYTDNEVVTFKDPDGTTNTLKAVWTVNTYTMHFEPNATTVLNPTAQGDITDCKSGEGVTLPECKYVNLPSCGFDGWVDENIVTNKAGTSVTNYVSQSGETLTYKAAWKDSGDLSEAVGLAGIAALTNQTTIAYWNPSDEGARTGESCVKYSLSVVGGLPMSMLVKDTGSLVFYYKKVVTEGNAKLDLDIDGKKHEVVAYAESPEGYQYYAMAITNGGIHSISWAAESVARSAGAIYVDDVSWITNVTTYTVAFYANGGSGDMKPQEVTVGIPTALKANEFKRTDYNFVGWATDAKGSVVYKDKAEVTNIAEPGKTNTLYAVWKLADVGKLSEAVGLTNAVLTNLTEYGKWMDVEEGYRSKPKCIKSVPGNNETSKLSMTVEGPGTVEYYVKGYITPSLYPWSTTSFEVYINDAPYESVSVTSDAYERKTITVTGSGSNKIEWRFVSYGTSNYMYMDDVRWTPGGEPKPFIFVIE